MVLENRPSFFFFSHALSPHPLLPHQLWSPVVKSAQALSSHRLIGIPCHLILQRQRHEKN